LILTMWYRSYLNIPVRLRTLAC